MIKTVLKEEQKEQSDILVRRKRALLVEKTGKGKTLTVLASFARLKKADRADNLFVFTPKNAYEKRVWKNEVSTHTDMKSMDLEELFLKTNSDEKILQYLKNYQIIYAKHTIVKKYAQRIKRLQGLCRAIIVIDEIHAMKNPKSSLTLYMQIVLREAFAIWALTATPLSKSAEDIYNIIHLIKPFHLGLFQDFKTRFCKVSTQVIGKYANGTLKKIENITGIINEHLLNNSLSSIVITGSGLIKPEFHYIDYNLSNTEEEYYSKIARGVFIERGGDDKEWFDYVVQNDLSTMKQLTDYELKQMKKHSSRFIYLQMAADGIIASNGIELRRESQKITKAVDKILECVRKGESAIVYFSYYASLEILKIILDERAAAENLKLKVLMATGQKSIKEEDISAEKVKHMPHVILMTKSGSSSVSYGYINNVILFHIPTVPEIFIQTVGRITRIDSLFLDNLHVHIMRSRNIDLYKLIIVSNKTLQMEIVSKEDYNIPSDYKSYLSEKDNLKIVKQYLIWNKNGSTL